MRTKIMKWLAITALVLAATWPSPMAYYVLLGFSACVVAFWTVQRKRTDKHLQNPAYATASPKVKYEN
jgi:hypothetical protein